MYINAMASLEEGNVFTCSICLEKFTSPKYLPCLHTFCELCIASFISSAISDCVIQRKRVYFLCPVCRRENYPPVQNISAEEWAKRLPTNYQLQAIADSLAKQSISKPVFCESCRDNNEENIATFRCKQCQHYLCETCCTFIHQRVKGFSLHTIIDLRKSKFQNDLIGGQGLCTDHPDKEITVYCSNHETLCCTFCLTSKHSDCTYLISLDEINVEDVKLHVDTLDGETQKMKKISNMAVRKLKKNIKGLNLEKGQILSKTAEKIHGIKENLDALYSRLAHSLNTTHEETISKLTLFLEKLELFDKNLSKVSRVSSAVMDEGNRKQMFVVLTNMQQLISDQMKDLSAQRKQANLAQLKWNAVDAIETLANLTKLGDFEYVDQPVDWVKQIDRHCRIIANDANPRELVCRGLKMKDMNPIRILPGLSTGMLPKI
ncbi:E3 ubiquitin-protein ligase TRIM45-like [Crassostrea virginica]